MTNGQGKKVHITPFTKLSVILPARNEVKGLSDLIPKIQRYFPDAEIIVVNDGSTDTTDSFCEKQGINFVKHPYGKGNGAAVKAGARAAHGEVLVFMDADGQHQPEDIERLLKTLAEGYDMVVGARMRGSQAGAHRAIGNAFYNKIASWMTGHAITDLTSGFRAVSAERFRKFLYLLPNGFSYPTTITMCFFRAGYSVTYIPIHSPRRTGKSHINLLHDGIRFLLIIFKIGTLYSPLKLFLPVSLIFFALGTGHYLYTFLESGRFTNMSALLIITSVLVFLIGLVSEQITSLNFRDSDSK
jgi:glycosyltransferase involved in cell wall biosynthesis